MAAALEEALRVTGRLDAARRFLHCYVDVFLMRALALEHTDREVAKAAYRELIALYAEHPLHHPEALRGVAWAREAVERLMAGPRGYWIPGRVPAGINESLWQIAVHPLVRRSAPVSPEHDADR